MAFFTKEIHLKDLLKEKGCSFEVEAFIIAANCCQNCLKRDWETFEIDDAIRLQPLPNPECTRKNGCVCCYGFRGKRNGDGRLIKKN